MVPADQSRSQPSRLAAELPSAQGHRSQMNSQPLRKSLAATTGAANDGRQSRSDGQGPNVPIRGTLAAGTTGGFNPQSRSAAANTQEAPDGRGPVAALSATPNDQSRPQRPQFQSLPAERGSASTHRLSQTQHTSPAAAYKAPPHQEERRIEPMLGGQAAAMSNNAPPQMRDSREQPGGRNGMQAQQALPQEAHQDNSQASVRCYACKASQCLKKVKCCQCHYCLSCLEKFIRDASRPPGNRLFCKKCGGQWDHKKLAKGCGLEAALLDEQIPNIRPPPGDPSSHQGAMGPMARSQINDPPHNFRASGAPPNFPGGPMIRQPGNHMAAPTMNPLLTQSLPARR